MKTRMLVMAFAAVFAVALFGAGSAKPASANGAGVHCVHYGETLFGIASMYGTSAYAIAHYNGLMNPNYIQAGTCLRIPAGGGYGYTGGYDYGYTGGYSYNWKPNYGYTGGYNYNWKPNYGYYNWKPTYYPYNYGYKGKGWNMGGYDYGYKGGYAGSNYKKYNPAPAKKRY